MSTITTATRPTGARRPRRRVPVAPYLFLAPAAVLFVAFLVLPAGYALVLSFRGARVSGGGIGRRVESWVGVDNYTRVLADADLYDGLGRLLGYAVIVIPVMLGLALLFALLLDLPRVPLRRTARLAIFLPYAVPGVVATLLWGFMYMPAVSPIHYVARELGLSEPTFLDSGSVLGAVANVAIWGGVGFNMVVLYTGLRALSPEMYEAARLDGASEWQIALRIKIPLLAPALVMTTLFSVIATLQVFNEPNVLRPLTNSISSSWVPLLMVYEQAFVTNDIYLAAATSTVITLITLLASGLVLRLLQSRAFGESR